MNHARAADERSDKANHEINRMIRGQNTEVADPRPEWIPGRERLALFEIFFVRQDTALRLTARPRGIHNASSVFTTTRDEVWITLATKFFPPISSPELRAGRRFCHQHNSEFVILKVWGLHNCAPQVIFDHQEL